MEFGAPQVSKDLPVFRPNRLAVMARTWEHVHVFDSTSHYTASPREAPSLGLISRILAHTFYNPQMNLEFTWSRQSGYNQEDLVALVEAGLEQDDDLIQQWFGGDEVLKLLRAAKTWEDTQIAVDAICGAHEVEPHVRHYVDEVLGKAGT